MSSAGQIVGAAVGYAVGTVAGGPFLGAQLGMMLGGYLDPPKSPTEEGPRLTDLTVQTSTYGAVIPDICGTDAVVGNIFWLQGNKIDETPVKKKTGGKGGQKKTTVTWVNTATFAIGLCRGPVVGVRRIWLGGELYYDAGSSDPGTIAASTAAAEGFKVYLGTDTQDADPRIQADLGVANTPAWRGRAYIVFYDLDLAKYSGSLIGVQAKVELMQAGSITYAGVGDSSVSVPSSKYICRPKWDGSQWFFVGQFPGNVMTSADGVSFTLRSVLTAYSWSDIEYNGSMYMAVSGTTNPNRVATSYDLVNWTYYTYGASAGWQWIVFGPGGKFLIVGYTIARLTLDYVAAPVTTTHGINNSGTPAWNGSVVCLVGTIGGVPYTVTSADGSTWATPIALPAGLTEAPDGVCTNGTALLVLGWSNTLPAVGKVSISNDNGASWSVWADLPYLPSGEKWCSPSFGNGVYCISSDSSREWATSVDGVNWDLHVGTTGGALFRRGIGTNGTEFARVSDNTSAGASWFTLLSFSAETTVIADPVPLADIVSAECLQSGLLTSGDIDVSQLTDLVRGYTDSSTGSIRDSLSPLQMAWPFDVRQRGYKLEFVRRGGASIRTIDANDLDARGPSTSPGVKITQAREMNLQLPRSVTVNHKDYDREYAVGEQYAERLSTDAVNEVAYELPIVMTASEAAQKADILLYLAWMERVDISFSLPNTYLNLEPGDVISLPVNGSLASVRIVSLTYTSDGRIEVTGKFASASTYVSSAVGVTTLVTAQTTLNLPGASSYALMDVPTMHATQLDPSFLVSMYGATGWPGGVLLRSDDSGTTWADLQAFSSPGGTAGSATSVIGVVDSRVWDNASVLSVGMVNGDLFSVTAEAVLNGANYFAYGADGRWEIIGVKTCTLVSANTYNLSTILRGRFGTEWAMSTHLSGDKVVLLSDTDVTAIGVSISVTGLMRTYRGVTLDQDVSTATDTFFTYAGVNLKPLSAAYCTLYRDVTSDDIVGSWVRRTRYGGEWADSIDVPLYETSESYQVDIFTDGSYSTVVRTLSASSQSVVYSAAEQTSDFGSYPATVYYKLYQLSSAVGRGYPFIGQASF